MGGAMPHGHGSACYVSSQGAAVMTGEFVEIEHVPGKSYIGRIIDIKHCSELSATDRRKWVRDDPECKTANFMKLQWCSVVGSDDGLYAERTTSYHCARCAELVLRAEEAWWPVPNILRVVLVSHFAR